MHHQPFLKPSMVKHCIQWAKENSGRDWTKIVFTDEAKIELGKRLGRVWVTQMAVGGIFAGKHSTNVLKWT